MKSLKPLFLKTYGKQRRKVSAWITPDDRRKAFDSTLSSDDMSVFEAAKPRRTRRKYTRVGSQRAERLAKKKAPLCLAEKSFSEEKMSDEENILPFPASRVGSNKSRKKNKVVSRSKRKAILSSSETSSNEDSIVKLPSLPTKYRKTARTSRLASAPVFTRQRGNWDADTTENDGDIFASKMQKKSAKTKVDATVQLPSAGRFVTHRRRVASTKSPEARVSLRNSSDDFTSGPFGSSMNQQPSRRRRVPLAFGLSNVESSVKAPRPTIPLREISLNESAENSIGSVPRRPIFCSTPSAPNFNKQKWCKFPSHVPSPPSALGSSVDMLSTFQEDPDSLRQPGSLYVENLQKKPSQHHSEDQSLDLFFEPDRKACRSDAKLHSVDSGSRKSASVNLLSADSGGSSLFVSATGGLEWLIEALKERCLSQLCTVQLERLNILPMTQLCSQTTYSSCLELSGLETKGSPRSTQWTQTVGLCSKESAHHSLSATSNYEPSVSNSDISASVSDSHAPNVLESPVISSGEISESVIYVDDTQNSYEIVIDTQLPAWNGDPRPKEAAVICSPTHYEKIIGMLLPSEYEHKPEAETESVTVDKAAALTSNLKEKCLASKVSVNVKKVPLSKLTEVLQPKGGTTVSDSSPDTDCKDTTSLKMASGIGSSAISSKEVEKSSRSFPKKDKRSLAHKERRRRSPSVDRTGTTRKACVSGMSVSRWRNTGAAGALAFRSRKKSNTCTAVDCSINELISKQHNQPNRRLGTSSNNFTPTRTSLLNLSCLLADFTPSTYTWSRLKAALSVHRKNIVQLTPRSLDHTVRSTPGRTRLPDISQDLFATPRRTPFSRHLQSQLLSQHSLVACEDLDLTDAEKVYAECGQQHPLSWEECIPPHRMKRCSKIGEGTFGEVFSTTNGAGDIVALKIIPVEGSEKVNGEDQKTFGEILHEIIISKELSSLKEKQQNQTRGFIGLNDLYCVQGCYPPDFLKAWDAFDQRKGSENDRPDFFEKDQIFIILEFEFGGADLENSNGTLPSLVAAKSILHQVTAALAVAEQGLHFEHRDLHWGNVLVKTTREKMWSFLLDGKAHSVEAKGVLVRIIDYSLSRLEIDDLTVSCDISNDEELFMGQGDYQFEIYRLMRQENGNDWSSYHPHTNVLWLHYLCSKLLSMKYKTAGGKGTKNAREELNSFYDNVLQFSSATDALQNHPMFR